MAYEISSSYASTLALNVGYASTVSGPASTYSARAPSPGGESIPGVCRQTCVRYGACTCKG